MQHIGHLIFFPPQRVAGIMSLNCNSYANITGDRHCNFQNQAISKEIQLIMAFLRHCSSWTHTHVKVVSSLHISLSDSSPFLEHIPPPSWPKQLYHSEEVQGFPRERNGILHAVRERLGMGCSSSSEGRPHSATHRPRTPGKLAH